MVYTQSNVNNRQILTYAEETKCKHACMHACMRAYMWREILRHDRSMQTHAHTHSAEIRWFLKAFRCYRWLKKRRRRAPRVHLMACLRASKTMHACMYVRRHRLRIASAAAAAPPATPPQFRQPRFTALRNWLSTKWGNSRGDQTRARPAVQMGIHLSGDYASACVCMYGR